jgi:hypothetical protein
MCGLASRRSTTCSNARRRIGDEGIDLRRLMAAFPADRNAVVTDERAAICRRGLNGQVALNSNEAGSTACAPSLIGRPWVPLVAAMTVGPVISRDGGFILGLTGLRSGGPLIGRTTLLIHAVKSGPPPPRSQPWHP